MAIFRLILTFLGTAAVTWIVVAAEPSPTDHRSGSLAKEEPQAVYAPDPADSWNRIFHCLFTRTVSTRLSDEFLEGAPFDAFQQFHVSRRTFERIESGDRAIDPLYPSSPGGSTTDSDGANRAMVEPLYSQFKQALEDALQEKTRRPPLARALMQNDLWAAYDVLSRNYLAFDRADGKQRLERRDQLRKLLAQLVKGLALTPDEIKALPDNLASAAKAKQVPDLFGAESGWLEIRWYEDRIHDFAADYRRVARVFIRPGSPPPNRERFVNDLRNADNLADQLAETALVTQLLLIDSAGRVVVSPLNYEVQVRTFVKDSDGKFKKTNAKQFELSRKRLLAGPVSSGFVVSDEQAPIYLSDAGNDYSFASAHHNLNGDSILVRLGTRCTSCHGKAGTMTFNQHRSAEPPPVRILKPADNEHASYVIGLKEKRKEFQSLREHWKSE